jgi:ribose-phosphate pyrophosphokinase
MSVVSLFAINGHEQIMHALLQQLPAQRGECSVRRFPDGESYVRVLSDVAGQHAIIVCGLEYPDEKCLPLLFLARALREQGAASVGLVSPYLAYMRQDKRFHDGEALTSKHFAQLVSSHVDWLITVDPHLHRYHAMSDVYAIPAQALHAAPLLSAWCQTLGDAFLIGPDAESEQWVSALAAPAGLPYVIASKIRHGDREVEITLPDTAHLAGKTPVLIDDVIASGMTMRVALQLLAQRGFSGMRIACVHALLAEGAEAALMQAGAEELVSVNTIVHASNRIDAGDLIAAAVRRQLAN